MAISLLIASPYVLVWVVDLYTGVFLFSSYFFVIPHNDLSKQIVSSNGFTPLFNGGKTFWN